MAVDDVALYSITRWQEAEDMTHTLGRLLPPSSVVWRQKQSTDFPLLDFSFSIGRLWMGPHALVATQCPSLHVSASWQWKCPRPALISFAETLLQRNSTLR